VALSSSLEMRRSVLIGVPRLRSGNPVIEFLLLAEDEMAPDRSSPMKLGVPVEAVRLRVPEDKACG